MGIRNRQGCCCGQSPCANACSACGGVTLKNGVVKDANGEWPLRQPQSNGGAWTTAPIPFETDAWTDGDCVQKSGTSYYSYAYRCGIEGTPQDGNVFLKILFSAIQCNGTAFYDGSKTPSVATEIMFSPGQFECDPVKATATFPSYKGLAPPVAEATVTLDIDDDTGKCQCRSCADDSYSYSNGDMELTYHIQEGDLDPVDGTLILKKTPLFTVGDYGWVGNVDWWTAASCSNPTADPSGFNVVAQCSSLNFLKWCAAADSGYRTAPGVQKIDDVNFTLYGPNGDKQGWAKLRDAPDPPPRGVCCYPCTIPFEDLKITVVQEIKHITPAGPSDLTTLASGTLTYSADPYQLPTASTGGDFTTVGHWKATGMRWRTAQASDKTFYYDCQLPFMDPMAEGDINYSPFLSGDPGYQYWTDLFPPFESTGPLGPFFYPGFTSNSTCDPFHMEYDIALPAGVGPLPGGGFGLVQRIVHFYVDLPE